MGGRFRRNGRIELGWVAKAGIAATATGDLRMYCIVRYIQVDAVTVTVTITSFPFLNLLFFSLRDIRIQQLLRACDVLMYHCVHSSSSSS